MLAGGRSQSNSDLKAAGCLKVKRLLESEKAICRLRGDGCRMWGGQACRAVATRSPVRPGAPNATGEFRAAHRPCRPRATTRIRPDLKLEDGPRSCCLVGPDLEAHQRVRPERLGDRDIGGIAPLCDQHPAYPRHVVARIEHVPVPAEIGFEPAGEISRRPRLRRADVAEI